MTTYELILKRRSIRKFSRKKIENRDLLDCVNAARVAPSASNSQPLEYIVVTTDLDRVFPNTRWARYLEDGAPKKGEEPVAYILILNNTAISKFCKYDVGLASAHILLTAQEKGVASCMVANLNRDELAKNLGIPGGYEIEMVIALGYPAQVAVEDEFKGDVEILAR